jgi:hypothetical protein
MRFARPPDPAYGAALFQSEVHDYRHIPGAARALSKWRRRVFPGVQPGFLHYGSDLFIDGGQMAAKFGTGQKPTPISVTADGIWCEQP